MSNIDLNMIFLSHAKEDKPFVSDLYDKLFELGYSVWFDKENIRGGDIFVNEIIKAIHSSRYFIVIVSSHSVNNRWVNDELVRAIDLNVIGKIEKIIPIVLDDCEVPLLIDNKYSRLDFKNSSDYTANFTKLLGCLLPPWRHLTIDKDILFRAFYHSSQACRRIKNVILHANFFKVCLDEAKIVEREYEDCLRIDARATTAYRLWMDEIKTDGLVCPGCNSSLSATQKEDLEKLGCTKGSLLTFLGVALHTDKVYFYEPSSLNVSVMDYWQKSLNLRVFDSSQACMLLDHFATNPPLLRERTSTRLLKG